jgi:hypothetical protein
MWTRRKPSRTAGPAPVAAVGPDTVSMLELWFPAAIEEHPAKRRIRRANELADEMRQTGGRHRIPGEE